MRTVASENATVPHPTKERDDELFHHTKIQLLAFDFGVRPIAFEKAGEKKVVDSFVERV